MKEFDKLTWKEKIIKVMKPNRWYSRKQIRIALGMDHKIDPSKTRAIGSFILRLVQSGHIERAHAPDLLKLNFLDHVHYVYRRTDKEYKQPIKIKPGIWKK